MNLTIEKIRNSFRKKFNVLRAKTAVAGIKALVSSHEHRISKINKEVDRLQRKGMEYHKKIDIYTNMLLDLKKEITDET